MNDKELYRMALEAAGRAYAPYSGFKVGAALLTLGRTVYTGVNVENSSYGASICAERTAFAKAVSEGEREFLKIAVASPAGSAMPCGICRQFMYEFNENLAVVTGSDEEHLETHPLNDLLLKGFRLEK
ncbi:MAG: cytidine deaminase [Clostridiales bacterium]|nr:cytidine deaminase [Clostridiales bacterium]